MPTPRGTEPPPGEGAPGVSPEVLILPIGQYVGAFAVAGQPGWRRHHLCLGGRIVALSDQRFALWGLAHGPLDPLIANGGAPWTRTELERYAGKAGIAGDDPRGLPAELVSQGLLAETPLEGPGAQAFASAHRAVPTMLGLGNTAEAPERFSIGFFDNDLLEVGAGLYELWAWSGVDGSLWQACETYARLAGAGEAEPEPDPDADPEAEVTDPDQVLAAFLASAHTLLSAGAMYLDRDRDRDLEGVES